MNIANLIRHKVVKNAGWIIGGRIVHMLCAVIVSLLTARYLGPSNYGLINYALSYTTFFYAICSLGINSIIVKVFVDDPSKEGEALGTTIVLQGIASLCSSLMIIGIVALLDGDEPLTIVVTALCTIGLFFQVFDIYRYWFQAHFQSKFAASSSTIAYALTAGYRVFLLVYAKPVQWFALATAIDYFLVAVLLFIFFKKQGGPKLSFSITQAKQLLRMGLPFVIAGVMVAIYGSTDKFMLKQMVGEAAVGYYSTAMSLCNMWVFVLSAIIDSMNPLIMKSRETDFANYEKQNKILYTIVFYVAVVVSVFFVIGAKWAVVLLYGEEYLPSIMPIRVLTWYVAFSYLGVARNVWIVSENKQRYITPIYAGAAITNVVLNFIFIPFLGVTGAAIASLITQMSTIFVFPLFIKPIRRNTVLLAEALVFKGLK